MTEPPAAPSGDNPPTARQNPSGPIARVSDEPASKTSIIRRTPTGRVPTTSSVSPTGRIGQVRTEDATHLIRRAPRAPELPALTTTGGPSAKAALATSAVAIISGWTTSVVATDLIVGWWPTDRLFCLAVGFLTLVFAATTVPGVILLLRRRPLGRYLVAAGAVVALLTFGSVFIAGARVPWIVRTIPVLQVASAALALHPATKRWLLANSG